MWAYEKKLQYPVNIKNPNPALAKLIITQLGGPDGELALRCAIFRSATRCRTAKPSASSPTLVEKALKCSISGPTLF